MAKPKKRMQHPKPASSKKGGGGTRPRAWHRGAAEGEKAVRAVDRMNGVFQAAEADAAAAKERAFEHRELVRDHERLVEGLTRSAPFVLALPQRLL